MILRTIRTTTDEGDWVSDRGWATITAAAQLGEDHWARDMTSECPYVLGCPQFVVYWMSVHDWDVLSTYHWNTLENAVPV